jgi:diguanylate cyclase (GGDEF)-like protein
MLPFTILVLDINNLKKINDDFGHSEGDNLIKLAADFLRSNFRQEDIIARIGGDEFCVLLPNTSAAVAASIKQRLLKKAGRHKTAKCTLSLSIGYAVKQDSAESIDLTLTQADNAMYKHKEKQKTEAQRSDLKFAPGSSHHKAETHNLP